jgi:hypothetical protein
MPNPIRSLVHALAGLAILFLASGAQADLKVSTEQANLRSGPAVSYGVSSVARQGEALTARRFQAGYVDVVRADGRQGWIHAASQGWSDAEIQRAMRQQGSASRPAATAKAAPASPDQATRDLPAPAASGPTAAHAGFSLTLDQLGFEHGHYFEGAYGTHSKDFYFSLPQDAGIRDGALRLYFRASPLLTADSTLRVDVNGKPARLVSLAGREQPAYLDVPLPADALTQDTLRLSVKATLLGSDNRCFDERKLSLFFVQILPQTGLTLTLSQPGSLAAAWTALPPAVRIGMPPRNTATTVSALLQTAIWLHDMGRKPSFVPAGEPADIIVDSEAELARRFPGALASGDKGNAPIGLARDTRGSPVILIADGPLPQPLAQRPLPWVQLLKAPQYRHGPAESPRRNGNAVDLIAAGLGDTQYVSRTVDWNLDLSPPLVPADKRLDTLVLNLVSTPYAAQSQQLLQVYVNGLLQEVRALERDGKPHTLRIKLDASLQRSGLNKLRIVVQRADEDGECRGNRAAFPVQLLPGSRIELADADIDPVFFNDLRAYLAAGAHLYITADGQAKLGRELGLLAAVFSNLGLDAHALKVDFLSADGGFKPDMPFVLLGHGSTPDKAPLRFDRGRATVRDGENRVLMDLDHLPGIGAAQIVSHASSKGLWLMAPQAGGLPDARRLHLDRDNLAFIDQQGVSFTLDAREPAIARVDYPDYDGWQDWFARHRFWILALAWTLVIAVAVALYRKSRQHSGK